MADERAPEQTLHRLVGFIAPSTLVLTPALTMVVSVIIARTLGPEGRGAYAVVTWAVSFIPALLNLGLEYAVRYWAARGLANRLSVLKTATAFGVGAGVIGAVIIVSCGLIRQPEWLIPASLAPLGVACFATVMLLSSLRGFWGRYLTGLERYGYATFGTNLGMAVQAASLGVLWISATISLNTVLVTLVLQLAVSFGLFFFLEGGELRQSLRAPFLPKIELREMFRYGRFQYLSGLLLQVNLRANIPLLAALSSPHETGIYAVVQGPLALLWMISSPLDQVLSSRTARRSEDPEFPDRVAGALRLTLVLTAAAGLIAAVLAPTVLPLIFGERFRQALEPFWILLPGTIAFSLVRIIGQFMMGVRRPEWNTWIAGVGVLVMLALSVWLIPVHGASGAALAESIAYLASTAIALFAFLRVSNLPARRLFAFQRSDWAPLARIVGIEPRLRR